MRMTENLSKSLKNLTRLKINIESPELSCRPKNFQERLQEKADCSPQNHKFKSTWSDQWVVLLFLDCINNLSVELTSMKYF